MFMLAFHIVAIGILVVMVWAVAYRRGVGAGERRLRRRMELALEDEAGGAPAGVAVPGRAEMEGPEDAAS